MLDVKVNGLRNVAEAWADNMKTAVLPLQGRKHHQDKCMGGVQLFPRV
jgi:hypothetical protein